MDQKNSFLKAIEALDKLSDEDIQSLQFSLPWQMNPIREKDPDGFDDEEKTKNPPSREQLQLECWKKFHENPFVGTAIRGQVGRLTGLGFEISSEIPEIQEVITETEYDPRNRLYSNWSKFVGRAFIEGELFLLLSLHQKGFVEVDFIDPSFISSGEGDDGVIYHPKKTTMPLFYSVNVSSNHSLNYSLESTQQKGFVIIPSIYVAYFPDLLNDLSSSLLKKTSASKSRRNVYNSLRGYYQFIVAWDRSFVTHRNVSHLRTVLTWLNHYENLKQYEIDHKKSSGAYLWVVTIEDAKAFRTWIALSDTDKRQTGIMAKKTPGGTLVLPPGMKIEVINPKLNTISDADTDILHMVTGGLNEPEDVSTGQSKGTFASVKASRGPMSDRISDEIAYFDRFIKYDFYRAVFFLRSKISNFPELFSVREAVDFNNQKPIFKEVKKQPMFLVDVTYPVSEVNNAETSARAYLGVKHGSVNDVLGIPHSDIAKKLGLGGNYKKLRLKHATEEEQYPELLPPVDAGGEQLDPGKQKLVKKGEGR